MVSYECLCVYWKWPRLIQRYQVCTVLAGAFLVHLTLGSYYTFGNMVPYMISFMRNQSDTVWIRADDAPYILASQLTGHSLLMFLGGVLETRFGPRLTTLLGGWLMSLGVLLTFFTIKASFWLVLVTYGLMVGAGNGIAYIGPIACVMRWLPRWKAVAVGIVVAGFGLSASIFNAVQTAFINPENLFPNYAPFLETPKEKYFTQEDLLERVPYCFLLLGGTYALMQFIGCIFLVNPPPSKTNGQDSYLIEKKESTNTDREINLKPQQVLCTSNFYQLWFMYSMAGATNSFLTSLYKQFGLAEGIEDHFLTAVGSVSAVFNLLGRILWGLLGDILTYKIVIVLLAGTMTTLMLSLYITTVGGQWMYLIWISGLFFCIGGNSSIFPAATAHCFGQKYIGVNYSLVFTCQIGGGVLNAFLASQLVSIIDWWGMFFVLSGLSFIWLLLALLHHCLNRN